MIERTDAADGQNSSLEAPDDQPKFNNDAPLGSAGPANSDQSDQVPAKIKPATSISDGSQKPPSDPPQDAPKEPSSSSAHPVADRGGTGRNEDLGGSLQLGLIRSPSELSKKESEGSDPAENPDPPEGKRKKRAGEKKPRGIGGRRNGPTQSPSSVNDDESKRNKPVFPLRPELICREVSRQWKVALSADDECNIDKVFLNGKSLTPVDSEYNLSSFHGDLSIRYANQESEGVPLFNDTPLIFKLRNKWKGDGRKVAGITSGHFIVIVPKEWKRTGRAPVESADCTDPDFVAHYFFAKKGESAGDTGGFEGYDLALTASGFEMSGHRVFDDSDEGELFVDAPPKLCPSSGIV